MDTKNVTRVQCDDFGGTLLQAPVLAAADGQKVHGTPAIARYGKHLGRSGQFVAAGR